MKLLKMIFLTLLCIPLLVAARGGGPDKITAYDYHDYMNENIASKTFVRYQSGIATDLVWSFDRSIPGTVLRTEIGTDGNSDLIRYTTSTFIATSESFSRVKGERYDPFVTPPVLIETTVVDPAAVKLTNAMVPGIAWASAGELNSTTNGINFFTDSSEVVAVENITVTAGSFNNCLKIYSLHQYGGGTAHSQMDWVCPDTGVVKRIHNNALLDLVSVTYNE